MKSRYLKLRYLEFCETQSVYLNQKYILIAFSNHNLALETFLQVKLTEVQIELVKNSPINFKISDLTVIGIERIEH